MESNSKDRLDDFAIYQMAKQLWDLFWADSEILMKDFRGKEIARQLTRSIYSISANIEEGFGRGFGNEYPNFLRYSRGSARETKGGYERAKFILGEPLVAERVALLHKIIAGLNNTLKTMSEKQKAKK